MRRLFPALNRAPATKGTLSRYATSGTRLRDLSVTFFSPRLSQEAKDSLGILRTSCTTQEPEALLASFSEAFNAPSIVIRSMPR